MTWTKNDIFEGMRFKAGDDIYEITNIEETTCNLTKITMIQGKEWSNPSYLINLILDNFNTNSWIIVNQPEVIKNNYTIF